MIFTIDFKNLILSLLPSVVRRLRLFHFVDALIVPIKGVYNSFYAKRLFNMALANATPQTAKMRYFLNFIFDPILSRIEIVDFEKQTYIYLASENKPLYLFTCISNTNVNIANYDFIVRIPSELATQENNIFNYVSAIKLPTKKFRIDIV